MKVNDRKVRWFIQEKLKGRGAGELALMQKVTRRRVEQLWQTYRLTGATPRLKKPDRPKRNSDLRGAAVILQTYQEHQLGAVNLENPQATTENTLTILKEAITKYGYRDEISTDRGSQFYANEGERKEKGVSEFEQYLADNGIKHILCRVNHPQTNGKLERFYGVLEDKMIRRAQIATIQSPEEPKL